MSHEGEFVLAAGFPAEVERGQEIAELRAIEDPAIENTATKLYRAAMAASERPSPALMVPISFSRLIVALAGALAEKRAISPIM